MNGDIAVRSMSASISARAERIMPLMSSKVIGSTGVVIASAPRQVDEQITVDVDYGLLTGKEHSRGVQLLHNGWPGHHMGGLERVARIHGRVDKALTGEIHWARLHRGRCRARDCCSGDAGQGEFFHLPHGTQAEI